MRELNVNEVENIDGGLVVVIFAVPIAAEALAAGVLAAGASAVATFQYLRNN
ncbi:class IIb bacteriocin, lactobin A/cerein 7B family [Thermomonas sp.]|uniref:class IIb bacteriocin, lactobin A/cerein 7B family n=1 Tax=Thermomonas sp. TaxID=1971895 RepID=UPI0039E218E5